MVNWGVVGLGGLVVLISLIFLGSSFNFVDDNGAYNLGGFALFCASMGGFFASAVIFYKAFD